MELREYQKMLALTIANKLKVYGIVYLAAEVRTGKTLTALTAAEMRGARNVLFLTKKKAISSIEADYNQFQFTYRIKVTNYEQAGNLAPEYDFLIIDEAHSLGAFPKPSLRTKLIKKLVGNREVILLSGTPSPESYSQLYHQFWISARSPFAAYSNFYKWAKEYVVIKQRMINGFMINDYTRAKKEMIQNKIKDYIVTFTQKEAGFTETIEEKLVQVEIKPETVRFAERILRDRYYRFKDGEELVADSPVKLQSKLHQIYSGTIITEEGSRKIIDTSKADFIAKNYANKKIAVFYKFTAEGEVLKQKFGDKITGDPKEFNESQDKIFISQIQSGAMGINLSTADVIIFYNIDFSSLLYWQARARSQSRERINKAEIHWLFSVGGIEEKIYEAVNKKKDYTTQYFQKDYLWKRQSSLSA